MSTQTSSWAGEGHAAPASIQRTCKATRLLGNVPIWAKGLLLPGVILVGLISVSIHIHSGVADLSRKLTHFSSVVRPAGVSLVQLRRAMTDAHVSLFQYVLAPDGGDSAQAAEAARVIAYATLARLPTRTTVQFLSSVEAASLRIGRGHPTPSRAGTVKEWPWATAGLFLTGATTTAHWTCRMASGIHTATAMT